MASQTIHLTVYGAEVKCASCVNAPGAKETYEWLQAAIARKYDDQQVTYQYVDIHSPENKEGADEGILQQLLDDELFYPLVTIQGEIVAEGNPRLKTIYKALESKGLPLAEGA
ncbi:YuzD family protein [Halobacillus locisalis]|uniref:YuzD family protein n=1 Tax=Halobacillus locisalis TaxID=220753 RepID=A0A838CV11_9BACI|nr:YuzD family protein [Halobacillus locisalis]MBA2175761.1 YuzD family protein [Halobacillus locisalis]